MWWIVREWILLTYVYVVNQQCHKLVEKQMCKNQGSSTGSCFMSFGRKQNKWRFWEKVMFDILGVDRNVIESAERYWEELGWKSKHWQKGRLNPESFKYTYIFWKCYLQHASVLSQVVFSLSVFIQSALFSAVPLCNFSVSLSPSQSFPLPVLFHLAPHWGTQFISACSETLLKCCTKRAEYIYEIHTMCCIYVIVFQSPGYLGNFAIWILMLNSEL